MLKINILFKKLLFSMIITIIILLGNHIPLDSITFENRGGEEMSHLSLFIFSLGMSPWMSAQILLRILSLGNHKYLSENRHIKIYSMMFVIAFIQSLAMTLHSSSLKDLFLTTFPLVCILIAGSYIIAFLANLNNQYGIGGVTVVFVINILLSRKSIIEDFPLLMNNTYNILIFILICIWSLLGIYGMVTLEKAEYRVGIRRILINNEFGKDAYLPLKLNLSSGMPFMYAFTILSFPQYVFMLIHALLDKQIDLTYAQSYFEINNWRGILVYMFILFVLSILFAFFNVDIAKMTETMQKSGDYIINVRPGKATERYLNNSVWSIGILSGLYISLIAGLPLLLTQYVSDMRELAILPGVIMMISGMMVNILQEVRTIQLVRGYRSIFDIFTDY